MSKIGSAINKIFITGESACRSACNKKRERITKSIAYTVKYLPLHLGLDFDIFSEMRKYYVVKIYIRIEEYPNSSMRFEEYSNLSVNQPHK